jgi:CheY-like chemotaxis protein
VVGDPPALILIDLASDGVPWQRWIQILKTSSATRRIPIVAFGPHVEGDSLDRARKLGADRVVTRGQLQTNLAEILQGEARPPDAVAIQEGCDQPASADARQGMADLAAGAYFEAHDHLERAVLDTRPGGASTVVPLHLAVACLHTERHWRAVLRRCSCGCAHGWRRCPACAARSTSSPARCLTTTRPASTDAKAPARRPSPLPLRPFGF